MKIYKQLYHYADNLLNQELQEISNAIFGIADVLEPMRDDSNIITFKKRGVYGSYIAPLSGNFTNSLKNALPFVEQRIYHFDAVEPTYPPNWISIGRQYENNQLNVIIAQATFDNTVEYYIL